jgi:hypothetical protein
MINNQKPVPWENNWIQSNSFPKQATSGDLEKILNTEMTRDRDLDRVKKNLPTLASFIEQAVESWSKYIYDLWSWKWIIADDIQDLYNKDRTKDNYIRVQRIDILWLAQRSTERNMPIWWRINWKMDIQKLKPWLSNTYSIFCMQYTHNAPDIIETIRNNLKLWCRAYIQFPEWLRTKKLLKEFIQNNEDKNIFVHADNTNSVFGSIIFETRKQSEQDTALKIPIYKAEKNIPLYRKSSGEKVNNSELFYHFFAENDPEREELQNIKRAENDLPHS